MTYELKGPRSSQEDFKILLNFFKNSIFEGSEIGSPLSGFKNFI